METLRTREPVPSAGMVYISYVAESGDAMLRLLLDTQNGREESFSGNTKGLSGKCGRRKTTAEADLSGIAVQNVC